MAEPVRADFIEQAREVLDEEKAFIFEGFDDNYVNLLGDAEIARVWKEAATDEIPELIDFLENFTSAKNLNPQKFVTDPKASGEEFKGIWRQVFVRRIFREEIHLIVQVLRKGFIQQLVNDSILDFSEARLDNNRTVPGDTGINTEEIYTLIQFPNIDPALIETIAETIRAIPVSGFNPVIQGESYRTGLHRLNVSTVIENDGSGTITLLLADPEYTLVGFSDFGTERAADVTYFWNVPKELSQALLTSEQGTGKSATASYNVQQQLVDIVVRARTFSTISIVANLSRRSCSSDETRDYFWGATRADAETLHIVPAVVPVGTVARKEIRSNGDGTYDVVIITQTAKFREVASRIQSQSIDSTTTEDKDFGVTPGDPFPDITVAEQGKIKRQDITLRDDCSLDITTRIADSSEHGISQYVDRDSAGTRNRTTVSLNERDAPADRLATPGNIQIVGARRNPDGTHDTTERIITPKDQSFGPYLAIKTRSSSSTREVFDDRPAFINGVPNDPLLPEEFGRLIYRFNEPGNIDGEKYVTSYIDPLSAEGLTIWPEEEASIFDIITKQNPVQGADAVWKLVRKEYKISYHNRESAAFDDSPVTDRGIGGGLPGSKVTRVQNGLWRALKIRKILHECHWRKPPIVVTDARDQFLEPPQDGSPCPAKQAFHV